MNTSSRDSLPAAPDRSTRRAVVLIAAAEDFTLFRKLLPGLNDKRLLERVAVLEQFVVTVLDDSCFVKVCVPEWRALYRRLVPGKLLTGEWKQTRAGREEFARFAVPLARKLLARFAADRANRSPIDLRPTPDVMWACMEPFEDPREIAYTLDAYIWHRERRKNRLDGTTAPIRRAYAATKAAREAGADVGLCDEHLRDFMRWQSADYLANLSDVKAKAAKVAGHGALNRGRVPHGEVARQIAERMLAGIFQDLSVEGKSVDTILNRPYHSPRCKDWVSESTPGMPRPTTISTTGRYSRNEDVRKQRRIRPLKDAVAVASSSASDDAALAAVEANDVSARLNEVIRGRRERAGRSRLRRIVLDNLRRLIRGETDCVQLADKHRCDRSALWRCYRAECAAIARVLNRPNRRA